MNILNKLKQLLCKEEQQAEPPQRPHVPQVSASLLTGYEALTPLFTLISPLMLGTNKQYFLADAVFSNAEIGKFTEPTLLVKEAGYGWLDLKFSYAERPSYHSGTPSYEHLDKQLACWNAGSRQEYNMKPPLRLRKSHISSNEELAEVVTTVLLAIRNSHSKTSQLAERIRKLTDETISKVTNQPLQDQPDNQTGEQK